MPDVAIAFYAEGGVAPAIDWLREQPAKVRHKFDFLIRLLRQRGSTLSRPHAAPLRDKTYELRVRFQNVNYRLLYFFDSSDSAQPFAIIAHGCVKEREVDESDIDRAVARRHRYLQRPASHRFAY